MVGTFQGPINSKFDSNPGQEKSNQIPNQKGIKKTLSVSSANQQIGLLIVSSKFLVISGGVMVINPRKSSISGKSASVLNYC